MTIRGPSYSVGDEIDGYELVQRPGKKPAGRIWPLGAGATSVVYLVRQDLAANQSILRALKLFDPTEELRGKQRAADRSYGEHNFIAEIGAIASLTHQNITKIIDAGYADVADAKKSRRAPYFVMEYVDGDTLEDILADKAEPETWNARIGSAPHVVIFMAQQVSRALEYIHSRNRYHFDIAPKNIFVRWGNNRPHLLLGDLGVSREVPPPSTENSGKKIFIAGTRTYTPPALVELRGTEVDVDHLHKHAAHWDIFALGKVILEMIAKWDRRGQPELSALEIVCKRMIEGSYSSAQQVTSELDRLLPTHVLTAGVEELSTDAYGGRSYISIPLSAIPVSHRVNRVLNHPALTRLQLVPQLLLYRSVTPGGVHTVYEHLLGSYGLMLKVLTKLLSQPKFRASFGRPELEQSIVAVLLTRLASFPFDRLLFSFSPYEPGEKQKKYEFLLDRGGANSLRNVLSAAFPDADIAGAVDILCKPTELNGTQQLIAALLGSSLDVRVMDYLARDSLHTGIPVGAGVDVGNIIDNLYWSDVATPLGVARAGVFSVEHLLCVRYWTFARLYWNTPNRATTAMLRHIVGEVFRGHHVTREFLARQLGETDEPGALAVLADHWRSTGGYDRDSSTIVDLLQQSRPRTYKLLVERFTRNWHSDFERSRKAMELCEEMKSPELESLRDEFIEAEGRAFFLSGKLDRSMLLFDVPRETPRKLGEDIVVRVGDADEPLNKVSDLVNLLPHTFFDTAVRFRAFCHPSIDDGDQERLAAAVTEFLNRRFLVL